MSTLVIPKALALTLAAVMTARGQGVATVTGRITHAQAGTPVVHARVDLDARLVAETDQDGRYVLRGVSPGEHMLHVARLGFAAATRAVTVGVGATTVDVALAPVPVVLDEMVSTATGDQSRREVGNVIATLNAD